MKTKETFNAFRHAFPKTIPVLVGFLFLGTAYGLLMSANGYGVGWAVLMSAIAFCGSMQYVAITLLTSTFNPAYALFLTLMVNARHLFYGISMLEKLKGTGKFKPFLIFAMCDETFSILCDKEPPTGVNRNYYFFFIAMLDYLYWNIATLLGGLLGNFITFNTKGLDFVLTALFVVIFIEQWQSQSNHRPAIIGVVSSLICLSIFGESIFIIPAMILILAVITIFYHGLKEQEVK